MPNPDFSEAEFQQFFLEERVKFGGVSRWDVKIPTLREEGGTKRKKALGYDAMPRDDQYAIAFFFQFKLPRMRTNKIKAEEAKGIHAPYWTFKIRTAKQHNALIDLRASHNLVYYVAPHFIDDLNGRMKRRVIVEESSYVVPKEKHRIAATDKDEHCYRYWTSGVPGDACKFYSEPTDGARITYAAVTDALLHARPRRLSNLVRRAMLVMVANELAPLPSRLSLTESQPTRATLAEFKALTRALTTSRIHLILLTERPKAVRNRAKTRVDDIATQ